MADPKKPDIGGLNLLRKAYESLTADNFSPEIQQGIAIAKREHPNMPDPHQMGMMGRFFAPSRALAITSPFNRISMNTEMLSGKNPQDVADVLEHENTHVEQHRNRGILGQLNDTYSNLKTPYFENPNEIEAFQASAHRQNTMGRPVQTVPAVGNRWITPRDVNLHSSGSSTLGPATSSFITTPPAGIQPLRDDQPDVNETTLTNPSSPMRNKILSRRVR